MAQTQAAKSRSRLGLYLGLAVPAAIGYYLYQNNGDAKAAALSARADARNAREGTLDGTAYVGAKVDDAYDRTVAEARSKAAELQKGLQPKLGEVEGKVNGWLDRVDHKVEEEVERAKREAAKLLGQAEVEAKEAEAKLKGEAAKAKSSGWFGGWFGGAGGAAKN
ncbi:hypothetical protein G7K_6206-t1 [Saitoella complicata NRRL Y-17804]|uniref:Uncharacterized protein n=1 Tax=Saitoella complicata (strain BCRC 22490 / CBS 7301 / JCM 7358 / NBRC 10748 / NRRL Y-17804) TaxID=698492 RepID=A0A0E9NRR5_SAICN|nr:hypothetical protein G7K_6206-t1 [Saitoella complicata NRRL Y-17804]